MSKSTLHILNRGPNQSELFHRIERSLQQNDSVLFIEDGVYWALSTHSRRLENLGVPFYVLAPDAEARGISEPAAKSVDDSGFVDLITEHELSLSWF